MKNQTVNGYTLYHQLGAGGMAEVWYAENRIGKKAAIKVIKKELALLPEIVNRFENEAKVMVTLTHPYIRQVYDYALVDNRPCIIMEYLEGSDLATRLKDGERFTDKHLKAWWNQLVGALSYTHQKGVIHRDIKPSNIFLTNEGVIKLLDFGIAKVKGSLTGTLTGTRMGTLLYMSPEQVKDSKHIDYRTDVYSLAVTFLHLLTGKAPYDNTVHSEWEIQSKIVLEILNLAGISKDWQIQLTPLLEKEVTHRQNLSFFTTNEAKTEEHSDSLPILVDNETVIEFSSNQKNSQAKEVILNENTNIVNNKELQTSSPLLIDDTKRMAYVALLALGVTALMGVVKLLLGLPLKEIPLYYIYNFDERSIVIWLNPLTDLLIQVIIWFGLTRIGKIALSPYWMLVAFLAILHSSLAFQSIQILLQGSDPIPFYNQSWLINTLILLNNTLYCLLFYTIAKQHRGLVWFVYSLLPITVLYVLFNQILANAHTSDFLTYTIFTTTKEAILNILIVLYFFKRAEKS